MAGPASRREGRDGAEGQLWRRKLGRPPAGQALGNRSAAALPSLACGCSGSGNRLPVPSRTGQGTGPSQSAAPAAARPASPPPPSPPTPAVPATALAARLHRASRALPLTARPSRRLLTVVRLRQGAVHRLSGRNEGRVPCATRCGMHLCTCLWCVVNVQEHVFVACCAHSRCRRSRGRLGHADRRRGPSLRLWRGRSTIRRRRFRWRLGDCGSFCGRGFAPPHHANHFAHATLRPFAVG